MRHRPQRALIDQGASPQFVKRQRVDPARAVEVAVGEAIENVADAGRAVGPTDVCFGKASPRSYQFMFNVKIW
jgi:hypothetical protein